MVNGLSGLSWFASTVIATILTTTVATLMLSRAHRASSAAVRRKAMTGVRTTSAPDRL